MALAGTDLPGENTPISFPTWKIALSQSGLADTVQRSHEHEILSFLRFCKVAHAAATVALARHYVARFGTGETPAREALRWFVRASWKTPVTPTALAKSTGGIPATAVEGGKRDEGVASPGVAGEAARVYARDGEAGAGSAESARPRIALRARGEPRIALRASGGPREAKVFTWD